MSSKNVSRFALVTGASSGIGASMARILAGMGWNLVLVARRKERLEGLAKEILGKQNVQVHVLAADLSAEGSADALYEQVKSLGLHMTILINNAGVGMQGKFLDMDMVQIEAMFRLNMTSLTRLTQLFGRDMKAAGGGYIMQVASMAAFLPSPYVSSYAATKSYVLGFSEAIWYELRDAGVSVTTLYPGITTTEFEEVAHANHPKMMNMSVLSADQVAKMGIRAMFKRKRAVIPGFVNNLTAFFTKISPRGMIIRSAGSLMKKANHQ